MNAPIQTFSKWVEIATDKLSLAAKERITQEIEAHFREAVESHIAAGMTDAQAETRTLADLGDAKAAAKRFRKIHLTESEAEQLQKRLRWARSLWTLSAIYASCLGILYCSSSLRKDHLTFTIIQILAVNLSIWASLSCWVARQMGSHSLRILLTIEIVFSFLSPFLLGIVYYHLFEIWCFVYAVVMVVCPNSLLRSFRLWFKIRRVSDVNRELQPPGASAT